MQDRWQNQEEALGFALEHPHCMLDMEMGTGKTRVAIDTVFSREDSKIVLVVCPKAVVPVWRENLEKFATGPWTCWDIQKGTVATKTDKLKKWIIGTDPDCRVFVIINYDSVWRHPMEREILLVGFDTVILDESHRAKAAGSKVSRYLAMLGRQVKYRMCLSGTPMANSPLDIYGQYRFLDPSIFGTNYTNFRDEYAIMGGPERRFVVGFKNQNRLNNKFSSIAYTCRMSDIAERIKLPNALPDAVRRVELSSKDMKIINDLNEEFIAACDSSVITANNVLVKMLRCQQITSGFCYTQENPLDDGEIKELNTAKEDALTDLLEDMPGSSHVVVFCVFKHDLDAVARSAEKLKEKHFELSGRVNQLEEWKKCGGVLAVQIQAGAEGVDMTLANHAIYYSLPHSLALYNQSRARLYRPGQQRPVHFIHILARGTIDEGMYRALQKKEDIIQSIKRGVFDFGYMK